MYDKLNVAKARLAEHGYKWTEQRRDILHMLHTSAANHTSAEELHSLLQQKGKDIGLATVYRTLELLVEMGLLHMLQFGDGLSRYELADNDHHHHHLLCNRCQKIYEVSMDLLEELEHKIEKDHDFAISGHHLQFYGICSQCKKNTEDGEQ